MDKTELIKQLKKAHFKQLFDEEAVDRVLEQYAQQVSREVAEKQRKVIETAIDKAVFYAEPIDKDIVYIRLSKVKNVPLVTTKTNSNDT